MGGSDSIVFNQQKSLIDIFLEHDIFRVENIKKIAWLGLSDFNNETLQHYSKLFPEAEMNLFDIDLGNWDINKSWDNIRSFDLVVCHRVTPYVDDMDNFVEELKKCIQYNKNVICDFTLYAKYLGDFKDVHPHWEKGSGRAAPGLEGNKFDFRNIFNFRLFHNVESSNPHNIHVIPLKEGEYLSFPYPSVPDAFTEKNLIEEGIIPDFHVSLLNLIKADVLTYALWASTKTKISQKNIFRKMISASYGYDLSVREIPRDSHFFENPKSENEDENKMKTNKEKYDDLMLRFAKEMHEVGVTEGMKKIVEAQLNRMPNSVQSSADETTRKFTYIHDGYMIQAEQKVTLTVKKCK